jgi:hypothetical protein
MPTPRSRRRPRPRRLFPPVVLALALVLGLVVGLPLLAGGGYLIYRLARPPDRGSDRARLDQFKEALTGRWEGRTDGGNRAVIEFCADGTSSGYAVVNGQRIEAHGRWEAVRVEGDRVIVRSTVEGGSVELPYWFISAEEYRYVTPRGQTATFRRIR